MLNTGIFANKLKFANITPIYKKGDGTYFSAGI